MLILDSPTAARRWSAEHHRDGRRVALVPTMGALHDGHLALVAEGLRRADVVAVSIFVNPLQFNRRDDFAAYPRPMDDDLDRCRRAGAAAVYAPTVESMYPEGYQTHIEPGAVAEPLEGAMRPGHFRGVTTVVAKLFNAVRPEVAVFGEKDFQQLAVIRRMVTDLDMGIDIVGLPTVREADGLAMSSRNRRLSPEQRRAAVVVSRALRAVVDAADAGEHDVDVLRRIGHEVVATEPTAQLEYLSIVDPLTLADLAQVPGPGGAAQVLIAVWFDTVRLIDNMPIRC